MPYGLMYRCIDDGRQQKQDIKQSDIRYLANPKEGLLACFRWPFVPSHSQSLLGRRFPNSLTHRTLPYASFWKIFNRRPTVACATPIYVLGIINPFSTSAKTSLPNLSSQTHGRLKLKHVPDNPLFSA